MGIRGYTLQGVVTIGKQCIATIIMPDSGFKISTSVQWGDFEEYMYIFTESVHLALKEVKLDDWNVWHRIWMH